MDKDKGKKKIAVIDDNTSFVEVLSRFLDMKNFEVLRAYNGKEGIKVASKHTPHLILLDIMMPGLSGYEVCERLKRIEKTKNIPIIFVTVRSRPEDIKRGYESGAVDYITKPFNYPELIEKINKIICLDDGTHLCMIFI
ncbi:MAG: response regulator [bacterium]